jgi:hypothetical protein
MVLGVIIVSGLGDCEKAVQFYDFKQLVNLFGNMFNLDFSAMNGEAFV